MVQTDLHVRKNFKNKKIIITHFLGFKLQLLNRLKDWDLENIINICQFLIHVIIFQNKNIYSGPK